MAISNPNQGFNKKKKNNLNPNNDPDFERNQQLIKSRLDRTKNVSADMTTADELLRGGRSPEQQAALEADRELKRIELEQALLNATPVSPTPTEQSPVSGNQKVSETGQSLGTQTPQSQVSSLQNEQNDPLKTIASEEEGDLEPLRDAINAVGGVPGIGQLPPQQLNPLPGIAGVTAKLVDAVRTAFSGKSSKQLTSAEEVMGTYMSALAEDVQLYRQGLKSFEDVSQNIKQAEASIEQYEANLVGEGRRNLNYWIDKGARIEANVIAQKDKLNDFKSAIINAGVQQI